MEDEAIGFALVFFQGANFDMFGSGGGEIGKGVRCNTGNGRSGDGEQTRTDAQRGHDNGRVTSKVTSRVGLVAFGRPAVPPRALLSLWTVVTRAEHCAQEISGTASKHHPDRVLSCSRRGNMASGFSRRVARVCSCCAPLPIMGACPPVRSGSRPGPPPDSRWTRRGFDSFCSRTEFARCLSTQYCH